MYHTRRVQYVYDHENRLISRTEDEDGGAGNAVDVIQYFVHDGTGQHTTSATLAPDNLEQVGQIVLRLNDDFEVVNRFLWGPQVDQLLADEQVDDAGSTEGDVLWALGDNLNTIRDLVRYDAGENEVEQVAWRVYDSFGNVTEEIFYQEEVDILFGYTGRQFDESTGLQNNLNRWLDAKVGRWISEDPIGFAGHDANVFRYVGNRTTNATDPSGLIEQFQGTITLREIAKERARAPRKRPKDFHGWFGMRCNLGSDEFIMFNWDSKNTDEPIIHVHMEFDGPGPIYFGIFSDDQVPPPGGQIGQSPPI